MKLESRLGDYLSKMRGGHAGSPPRVPGEEILWRFHFMMGAMSYALSGTDALHIVAEDALDDSDSDALYARLMSFMLGGLRAPLPELGSASAKRPRVKKVA